MLKAQQIIEEELAAAPSVEDLAKRVAMSRRNFIRRFKTATGNVPREYLQRVRIESAKRALESSPKSIGEISQDVRYGDVVAFRRLFLRWTGLTPSDYRLPYGPRSAPMLIRSATSRAAGGTRGLRSTRRAPSGAGGP